MKDLKKKTKKPIVFVVVFFDEISFLIPPPPFNSEFCIDVHVTGAGVDDSDNNDVGLPKQKENVFLCKATKLVD